MESSRRALVLALSLLLILATVQLTACQTTPRDYVDAHNSARRSVGVGPVRWDPSLASYARDYASRQTGDCLPLRGSNGPYGENMYWQRGGASAYDAVDAWMSEGQYYNYRRNTCAPGRSCRRYKQVVWARSTRIGCARARCDGGATYMICEYSPRGNVGGQRPY